MGISETIKKNMHMNKEQNLQLFVTLAATPSIYLDVFLDPNYKVHGQSLLFGLFTSNINNIINFSLSFFSALLTILMIVDIFGNLYHLEKAPDSVTKDGPCRNQFHYP
ncbi:hypothetical protein L484_027119 [Morus notabilis]|uniref:Uncharacterized protein n=1 Tax=Morus notabilis TaxID=981085 RepID=W9S123_9ROSA|nr:hypothetical protein L484_027119 [Morus notabilis]